MQKKYIKKEDGREGVTLLLVVVLISGIFSMSLGVFAVIFNQIRATGQLEASFHALYAADQGTERLLRIDRTGTPLANGFNETNNNLPSGACVQASLTKDAVNTFLKAVGTYPCASAPPGGIIRRAFQLVYPTVGPPVLHWKLTEGPGSPTAGDSSGNGNDGTLDGPSWQPIGGTSYALSFNGTTDVVDAGNEVTLRNLPAFSVSAWIYPKSAGEANFGRIVQKGNGNNPAYGFRIALAKDTDPDPAIITFTQIGYDGNDLFRSSGDNTIALNLWQHVMVTWTGLNDLESIRIYKNGAEIQSYGPSQKGTGNKGDDGTEKLWVGNIDDKTRTFDGCIGPLKIWNRALTPDEIHMDFDAFAPTGGC